MSYNASVKWPSYFLLDVSPCRKERWLRPLTDGSIGRYFIPGRRVVDRLLQKEAVMYFNYVGLLILWSRLRPMKGQWGRSRQEAWAMRLSPSIIPMGFLPSMLRGCRRATMTAAGGKKGSISHQEGGVPTSRRQPTARDGAQIRFMTPSPILVLSLQDHLDSPERRESR